MDWPLMPPSTCAAASGRNPDRCTVSRSRQGQVRCAPIRAIGWRASTRSTRAGARVLAVSKANYGPARILAAVDPVRSPHGEIVGFAGGPWQTPAERNEAPANGDGMVPAPGPGLIE